MKKLLVLLLSLNLFVACDIFDDDEDTASSGGSSNATLSFSCEQLEEAVDTSVVTEYGVAVDCENQVLSATGTGLSAEATSSCLGTTVTVEGTDIDFQMDFSDLRYALDAEGEIDEESITGSVGFVYDITIGTIDGLPNISNIDCDVDFDLENDEDDPSIENFNDFSCTYTYGGTVETITKNEVVELGQVLAANPNCEDTLGDINDLGKNEEIRAAIDKLMELADELLAEEF